MDFFNKAQEALGQGGGGDIVKEAEGLIGSGGGESKTTDQTTSSGGEKTTGSTGEKTTGSTGEKTDYKELYGSAQTLYKGIQDKASGKSDVSDSQLAGAADDVLKAAENSGLDKNNQYGQYFDKAESYLEKYKTGDTKGSSTDSTKDTSTDTTTKTDSSSVPEKPSEPTKE